MFRKVEFDPSTKQYRHHEYGLSALNYGAVREILGDTTWEGQTFSEAWPPLLTSRPQFLFGLCTAEWDGEWNWEDGALVRAWTCRSGLINSCVTRKGGIWGVGGGWCPTYHQQDLYDAINLFKKWLLRPSK